MKYFYKARTKEGEIQVGDVEAANKEMALSILLSHGLFVLSLELTERPHFYSRILNFFKRVKVTDLMIFTRQFSTLLGAQVSLGDSLKNLFEQTTNPVLKEIVSDIASDIESGLSLSQALERHPKVFSDFFVNMVKSAEVSGRLAETLEFLADYLEKQVLLTSKVRNALIYPAFIVGLFFVVLLIMSVVVFPQLKPVFEEAGVALPFFTRLLLGIGSFLVNWWFLVFIIFIVFVVIIFDYFQTQEGKAVLDELKLRLPLFGSLFQKIYVVRFADSVRVLIQGGLTLPQAVEISSHTIGSLLYQELLHEAAEGLKKGQQLSQILAQMPRFPLLVSQLVAIGESTGRLDALLGRISNFYTREVEAVVNNLVELIQPILMVVIGLAIGLLFASILLPLYSLINSV
ncbi:hypothetical protein COS46_00825 [Candidatus Jorgensenbacteria bacterium CG03_land_8_20_14_0_80_38_39]|nr:MAG: hypothetical protein COS46_00825 [Candidatus Jorgensenbacteria bacterium CG03_land_8_20_14_0_80_38_39]